AQASEIFRIDSDWGSAFAGQDVVFRIRFQNLRAKDTINNLQISTQLPDNVVITGQDGVLGEPQRQGNLVTMKVAALQPQQETVITIRTKIKDDVEAGTRLIGQAEATYDGLALPLRSNIATILIVGSVLGPLQANVQAASPSATTAATATAV